jgi:alanyl-tRNA synthetase
MKSSEIRKSFLEFFERKGHRVLPGSSLVPSDPTVLLTLAGMLQFKPIFLGQEKPSCPRAATVQKCMRTIDIDKVGRTPRHHTFFEMLGNFSFGDYFKKEAIQFAWELLTKEFKIDVLKLKIAVFEKDDEAFEIWHRNIGLPKEIIFKLGEDNNFWAAGPTGPCGPCSEIYYDLGPDSGCGKPGCQPGCDCDRYLEIWNLVFIQFNRDEKGALIPLKQKGIDTGMGLERIASVLQGVKDNYATDLFIPLIKAIRETASKPGGGEDSQKIIADHIRAAAHLIADGVFPENAGRGYVLRRIIRRAIRHGKLLGIDKPFLFNLSREVIALMRDAYPQLKEKEKLIAASIKTEEESFLSTLEQGSRWFEEMAERHKENRMISGEEAFKLHDTYGFPVELTVELAEEKGLKVDLSGFEKEMEKQRERARQAGMAQDKKKDLLSLNLSAVPPTNFIGYDKANAETKIIALFPEQKLLVLEKTPFYGESGGQAGDTGIITRDKKEARVINTLISPRGTILHVLDQIDGLKDNQKVNAAIDVSKRGATEAHHTATHLLHRALRETLGEHVKQAGSYVGPDKLRFDFNHPCGLSSEELQNIEQIVNQKISKKIKVEVLQKSYPEALKMGATALFGEKYGERVRVVKIGDYSLELCGGTHARSTADLLFFKIISEGALGSGLRRIEAVAGQAAKIHVVYRAKALCDEVENLIRRYRLLQVEIERLGGTMSLETNIFEIELTEIERLSKAMDNHDSTNVNKFLDHLQGRVDWLKERILKAEKEIDALKVKRAQSNIQSYLSEVKEISGKKTLFKVLEGCNLEMLRTISDALQTALKSCVLLLVAVNAEKVNFLLTVTEDLVGNGISAKALAGKFAEIIQGRCGGRENKAEGGGRDPAQITAGFAAIEEMLQ